MKEYFQRLKEHPGVPVVSFMTIAGVIAAMANKSIHVWWHGVILGLICISPFWMIVLISNFKKRK